MATPLSDDDTSESRHAVKGDDERTPDDAAGQSQRHAQVRLDRRSSSAR